MYDVETIRRFYCVEDYEDNPYFSYDFTGATGPLQKRFKNYIRVLKIVEGIVGIGIVLDIGCGTGSFLYLAKERGWDLHGIEISEALSRKSKTNVEGARIATGRFEDLSVEGRFDLISMWGVLEHVIDPISVVEKARSLLKPGGMMVICTPDEDSALSRVARLIYKATSSRRYRPSLALHPLYHSFFFSKKGVENILRYSKMDVIKVFSQEPFFQHSELPSRLEKAGITIIEKLSGILDLRYEAIVLARRSD